MKSLHKGSAGGISREESTGRRPELVKPPTAAPVRAANAEMMEASTGAVPNQLPELMTARPHYYYDADDRGPSEISRELR
jgi:hypothetical protein